MSNTVKIVFHSDVGHGWGRVTRNLIEALGVADKISEFSYQHQGFVYLEEDCDLSRFIAALHSAGYDEEIVYLDPVDHSPIRNLSRYTA